jgi:hypothetical protein
MFIARGPINFNIMDSIITRNIVRLEQLLITESADFQYGSLTPLISAIIKNDLEITRILLSHGADPNFMSQNLTSPLLRAVLQGNVEITRALLNCGADPNLIIAGKHPLIEALRNQYNDDIILELLHRGTNPKIDICGTNAMGMAILAKNYKAILALEQFGAKRVLICGFFYENVYSYAYERDPEMIRQLTSRPIEVINHFKTMPRIISGGKEVVMGGVEFLEAEERYIQNQIRSRAMEAANKAARITRARN